MAQGFSQQPEDYDKTYVPVAKMTSICVILTFAATHDLEIMALDVKTAFLHCCLCSELYCKQIPGYPLLDPSTVLCVLVTLYGLHQSAFEFFYIVFSLWACTIVKWIMLFFMAPGLHLLISLSLFCPWVHLCLLLC